MRTQIKKVLALAVLAALWTSSTAFINPNFTPVDLVKQSDTIVQLEDLKVDKDGMVTATVKKVLKGEMKEKELKIDLMGGIAKADGQAIQKRIENGATSAVLFTGLFAKGEDEGGQPAKEVSGRLNVGGGWIDLTVDKPGAWDMDISDDRMLGTWSGGTDMLLRVVNYVLTDPDANLPVRESVEWGKEMQLAKIDGKIYATAPVDVAGNGKIDLFIAAEKGDRLLRWNGKSFDDLTAKSGLTSKSAAFAWGDFNSDGKLDLASWDGKDLSILSQNADGAFTAKTLKADAAIKDGVVSLTTIDSGDAALKGRPAILVSGKGMPQVLTIAADGSAAVKPLVAGEWAGKELKNPAECVVADFDNDGLPDVIQLGTNGSLLYKGTKPGEFAPATRTQVAVGEGKHGVCVGDWDADGLLDIFTCSEETTPNMWQNKGKLQFSNTINLSGSVAYISKAGGTFAQTVDFNGDGRQGLVMLYAASLTPQLFFNRGFRSFGLSRRLEGQMKSVPQAKDGQQAGCVEDFTGEGAGSMVLALTDGEVWFFPRKIDPEAKPLGVRISMSTASPHAGPVTIWASTGTRAMGAAEIRAGQPGMLFGAINPGAITVKWQFPGEQIQQKLVRTTKDTGVVNLVIDKTTGKPVVETGEKK